MLDQDLRNTTVIGGAQTAPYEHVTKDKEEPSEEEREQISGLNRCDENEETYGCKGDEKHSLRFFLLFSNCLFLHLNDAFSPSSRNRPDAGNVLVVLVGVHQDIFEVFFWQEVRHRTSQHRFSCTWVPDHEHVTALFCCFLDHDRTGFLTDDLVD